MLAFFSHPRPSTQVMGGFDDFKGIRKICDRHGLWMHVDAAWGGGGETYRNVMLPPQEML